MFLPLSHLNSIHRCCLHDSDSMKGPKGQQRNLGMEKKPLGLLRARTFLRPAETLCLILPWHQPPTHIFSSGIHSVPVPVHVPVPVPVPHPLTHTHTHSSSHKTGIAPLYFTGKAVWCGGKDCGSQSQTVRLNPHSATCGALPTGKWTFCVSISSSIRWR